jgi:DUF4097 and DUF4098 domain-containing protein YvlB
MKEVDMGKVLAFTLFSLLVNCQSGGIVMTQETKGGKAGNDPARENVLPAPAGGNLSVELDTGGTVALSIWDREAVSVTTVRDDGDGRDAEVEVRERPGGGVLLTSRYTGDKQSHATSMRFDIKVPKRFDVRIASSGGAVSVTGLDGTISGHTNGGDLILSGARGRIDLSTGGGNVTLNASELDGQVSTGGGNVLFRDVKGNVQGRTGGGTVMREEAKSDTQDSLKISKGGGRIDIADAPKGASLETGGGSIHVGSSRHFIMAQTGGGDIIVDAVDGWVQATTGAGKVSVTMTGDPEKGKRDVSISSGNGDVTLVVPEGLSMDLDLKLAYTDTGGTYRIDSDFPVERRATDEWSSAEGTARKYILGTGRIAGGRNRIKIHTVNGNIHLRKGR